MYLTFFSFPREACHALSVLGMLKLNRLRNHIIPVQSVREFMVPFGHNVTEWYRC